MWETFLLPPRNGAACREGRRETPAAYTVSAASVLLVRLLSFFLYSGCMHSGSLGPHRPPSGPLAGGVRGASRHIRPVFQPPRYLRWIWGK